MLTCSAICTWTRAVYRRSDTRLQTSSCVIKGDTRRVLNGVTTCSLRKLHGQLQPGVTRRQPIFKDVLQHNSSSPVIQMTVAHQEADVMCSPFGSKVAPALALTNRKECRPGLPKLDAKRPAVSASFLWIFHSWVVPSCRAQQTY